MVALGLGILAIAAWAAVALLARAGLGGTRGRPAISGGLLAGALLGPTLLGRVAPDLHEDLFVGARAERERWSQAASQLAAQRAAERAAGITMPAAEDVLAAAPVDGEAARVRTLEAQWEQEAARTRWPQQVAVLAGALVVLLAGLGARSPSNSAGALEAPASSVPAGRRGVWIDAALVGLWSAAVPALGLAILLWWSDIPVATTAALWAMACVGVGIWALDRGDRAIADECEAHGARLLGGAGVVASVAAAAVLVAAAMRVPAGPLADLTAIQSADQWMSLQGLSAWVLAAGLLVGATWAACVGRAGDRTGASPRNARRRADWADASATFAARWLLPPLATVAMVHVELFRDASLWIVIVTMLLAGEGRSLGAFAGAALPGSRPWLGALRLSLVAAAAAPSQLALVAVGGVVGALDPAVVMALLLASGLLEATGPSRVRVAAIIRELEGDGGGEAGA